MTPSETILDFLAKQPHAIRETLYAQIGMDFFEGDEIINDVDLKEMIIEALTAGTGCRNLQRAIGVCDVLDPIFSRRRLIGWAQLIETVAEITGSETLRRFARQVPLHNGHFRNASAMWRALRESTLSAAALHEYQATRRNSENDPKAVNHAFSERGLSTMTNTPSFG